MIHERIVGKILKKEGLIRKYRVGRIKYKHIRAKRKPGKLIEIDVKYVPDLLPDANTINTRPLILLLGGDISPFMMDKPPITQLNS